MMIVTVYQIADEKFEDSRYAFMPWRFAEKHFNLDDYSQVYTCLWEVKPCEKFGYSLVIDDDLLHRFLEGLYAQSNKGEIQLNHSMSMSDVIQVGDRFFYCDTFGFTEITEAING